MKVQKVQRYDPKRIKSNHYLNCNLIIADNNKAMLSGSKFGHIADGDITKVHTTYNSSDYQMHFEVMVEINFNKGIYRKEDWFVKF